MSPRHFCQWSYWKQLSVCIMQDNFCTNFYKRIPGILLSSDYLHFCQANSFQSCGMNLHRWKTFIYHCWTSSCWVWPNVQVCQVILNCHFHKSGYSSMFGFIFIFDKQTPFQSHLLGNLNIFNSIRLKGSPKWLYFTLIILHVNLES